MARGPRSVTLVDVARAAAVSRTTASAALSGTGRISSATRARVEAIAESLGYVANPAARNLRGGRKGAIALYVPDRLTGYAFYMELAFGVAQVLRGAGIALTLVAPTPTRGVRPLLAHVDAFLMVDPLAGDPFVEAMIESGVPVVAAERVLEGRQPTVTVETDHKGAILDLLDHLWEQGARSPAMLGLDLPFAWARLVGEVYLDWCHGHDIAPRLRSIAVEPSPHAVRDVARSLLLGSDPPDAIVGAPDGAALGVLSAARDAGRSVGDDLLVASCVDSLAMQLVTPAVTAIDLRPREIGYDSANVLLRLIEGEELPQLVRRARPHLELRQSTSRSVAAASFV
jgi:DNA-binding LacI/PurR family transcriptional regulator